MLDSTTISANGKRIHQRAAVALTVHAGEYMAERVSRPNKPARLLPGAAHHGGRNALTPTRKVHAHHEAAK